MKRYIHILYGAACLVLMLAGCSDKDVAALLGGDGDIKGGEPVLFTTYVPNRAATKAITTNDTYFSAYKAVQADYTFTVKMYQQPATPEGDPTLLGTATYKPATTVTNPDTDTEAIVYPADGTLQSADATPLYWPGNAMKYGFEATAGSETLATDQTDAASLLLQDRLLGYGFEPLWDTEAASGASGAGAPVDDETALNYRTSKEWYDANRIVLGVQPASEYKKIPLYLRHQRAMLTIRLKAGEGVDRDNLYFSQALAGNIETDIFSYVGDAVQTLQPFVSQTTVDYTASDYGTPQDGVETTQYTAIVEPYSYLDAATSKPIAEIRLSGQRYTFYASNDALYAQYEGGDEAAVLHMQNYDLTAGKHLVITATLGRESRKILITAYVEDWTETVTTSIVDDYGQAGDPIQINSREELREFLKNDKNKAGNVAIIVPNALNLEQELGSPSDWEPQPLHCTLNMAGATFRTNHQVFSEISASGNLVNGTITVGDATVDAAVATSNYGTIEHVDVAPKKDDGTASAGKATQAGLVVSNYGTVIDCESQLPVRGGKSGMVGGIAAYSTYADNGNMPIIDGCTVNARVDGTDDATGAATGGGIVGAAVGRVTNNTYEYGITILQDGSKFENIIHSKADDDHDLRLYGNAWPTTADNAIGSLTNPNGTPVADRYTAVIDCEAELQEILKPANNRSDNIFRLSNDFTVEKANGGTWGNKNDVLNSTSGNGDVGFKLDGNNKTITTDVMLFSNIMNDIYDLTIRLGGDLLATYGDGNDVMAPLGYSVYAPTGQTVTLRNIQVKGGSHRIQASTAAGLVVWAYGPGSARIEDCQVNAKICVWLKGIGVDAKIYSGGIVANAARATITRCVYHTIDETLYRNTAADSATGTPEDGDDKSTGIFFGGILGATSPKTIGTGTENPQVLITDCASWFSTTGSQQKGAIVGYAEYSAEGSVLTNGIADGCQGNWWETTSDAIGTGISGKTDEQIIGKRNAVAPTRDEHFDPTN